MSKLKILSSGSHGNCVLVYDSRGKCVMLDMGLPWVEIMLGLDFDLSSVSLALVTHRHVDHTRSLAHCISNGIPTLGNYDICEHYKGCYALNEVTMAIEDGFKVQTFDLVHNAPNNAFIVDTIDQIRVLYCTDTQYIPKRVKGVNYAIIECNHDDDTIIDNMCEGIESRSQYENHQSLDKCIEYLKQIYNKDLMAVILWHPSSTNLDKKKAVERVKYELGFENVYMAERGLEIPLEKEEF